MKNTKQVIPVPLQLLHNQQDLFHLFPEIVDALEVFYVLNDLKPVCRIMIHENKYPNILDFCRNNKLHLELSGFKILKNSKMFDDFEHIPQNRNERAKADNNQEINEKINQGLVSGASDNHSKKALIVKTSHPQEGEYFMYISKSADEAQLAKFYEHIRNDEKLGELLGYPKCCIKFYKENYDKASRIGDEYCFFSIANTKVIPSYLTNNMLRFFGITLLSHFPCSFDCVNSLFQAKQRIEALRKANPELAKYFEETLKGPVIAHANTGVHALKDYKIDGKSIMYKKVWITSPNPMHNLLCMADRVDILGKNHIKIMQGKHIIDEQKGEGIAAIVFE